MTRQPWWPPKEPDGNTTAFWMSKIQEQNYTDMNSAWRERIGDVWQKTMIGLDKEAMPMTPGEFWDVFVRELLREE